MGCVLVGFGFGDDEGLGSRVEARVFRCWLRVLVCWQMRSGGTRRPARIKAVPTRYNAVPACHTRAGGRDMLG